MKKTGISDTRFVGLGYSNYGPKHWQFVDRDGDAQIGPIYPTKAELLADVENFARDRGFTEHWPAPFQRQHAKTLFLFANGNAAVFNDHDAGCVPLPSPSFSWLLAYVETLRLQGIDVDENTELLMGGTGQTARLFRTSEGEWNWEFVDKPLGQRLDAHFGKIKEAVEANTEKLAGIVNEKS